EDAQMAAQISVGQTAEPLQIAEHEPLRVRGEGGQHREARALVDHAVEPLVRESSWPVCPLRHRGRPAGGTYGGSPRRGAGRRRTPPPSRRARGPARTRGRRAPTGGTRRRPRRSAAGGTDTRRTRRG